MRYILVNDTRYDYDSEEFDSLAAAVIKAQDIWGHLTRAEKDTHDVYVLDSANPDEEADNHMDGDVVYDAEWEQDCGKDLSYERRPDAFGSRYDAENLRGLSVQISE